MVSVDIKVTIGIPSGTHSEHDYGTSNWRDCRVGWRTPVQGLEMFR
jgi:hypothetical protein